MTGHAERRGSARHRGDGRSDGSGNRSGGHRGRRGDAHRRNRRGDDHRRFREPKVDDARLISLQVLTKVREDDAYANLVLPGLLDRAGLGRRDAGFATTLTYGTLRLQGRYDAIIAHCVDRPLRQVDDVVLDILRLGAHQLLGMRVPSHAAVSSTVDLAACAAGRGAATFVNAVLRRVSERDLDGWLAILRAEAPDATTALAAIESHPIWVVKAMRQALLANNRSEDELGPLLQADNAEPEVVLCARPGMASPEGLAKEAEAATRREPRSGNLSPCAVVLTGGDPGRIRAVRERAPGSRMRAVSWSLSCSPMLPSRGGTSAGSICAPGRVVRPHCSALGRFSAVRDWWPMKSLRIALVWSRPRCTPCPRGRLRSPAMTVGSSAGMNRGAMTGFSWTPLARDSGHCAVVPRPGGGASPRMSPNSPLCSVSCWPVRWLLYVPEG